MPEQLSLSGVEKLGESHDLGQFNCGKPPLDSWLKKFALINQSNKSARTYVVHRGGAVIGYFSLAAGSVAKEEAPERIVQGLANHPVPVVLLARLAVDVTEQGKGLGSALLKDALLRIVEAADVIGVRAVLVHALDEEVRGFYEHHDFERSPVHDMQLMLLMKDLKAASGV